MHRALLAAAGLTLLAILVAVTALAERWRVAAAPVLDDALVALAGSRPGPASTAEVHERLASALAETARLRSRLADYQGIAGEDALAGIAPVARGRVVERTSRLGRRYIALDIGGDQGVVPGLAVVAGRSLVGVVAGIRSSRCLVQLVSDSMCRIPAALVDPRQAAPAALTAQGVAAGTGRAAGLRMDLVEDLPGLVIAPGQVAVSTGGTFPAGLVLGVVETAVRPGGGQVNPVAANGGSAGHWRIDLRPLRTAEQSDTLLVVRAATR